MNPRIKNLLLATEFLPKMYDWWIGDHWIVGKIVELLGDNVPLENCRFDLSNAAIQTPLKSRFILNRYEKEERIVIKRFLKETLPVVELGGCIGVISCVTNKKLKNKTQHVVIEANPELIPVLEKNKYINGLKFKIINAALGYQTKKVKFYLHQKFVGGSLQRKTDTVVSVPVLTLGKILKRFKFKKINLICDIEGGEYDLVMKELPILIKNVVFLSIEVHPAIIGESKSEKLVNTLNKYFEKCYFKRQVYVFKNIALI